MKLATRFTRRTILASIGAAMLLAGTVQTSFAAEKITVGALRFTSHSPSFIAFERGYFADEGLDVEFKFFQAAAPMAVAIASGDVDFGVTAITGGLMNLAGKNAVKVVGGALHEEKGVDGSAIVVSMKAYGAGLDSPAKLGGNSFAITQAGSSFHYMAAQIAKKEGIDMKTIKLVPLHKVGAIIGALKSGQVDAWAIVPHIAKALAKGKKVKIIGWINDYAPDYQVTTVTTSAKNASENKSLVKRFLKAFSKGGADFNAALVDKTAGDAEAEKIVRLIHKYVYASRPYEKAAPSIRNGAMRISKDAELDVTSVKAQMDWFQSEKLVKGNISIDQLVDTSFVKTR